MTLWKNSLLMDGSLAHSSFLISRFLKIPSYQVIFWAKKQGSSFGNLEWIFKCKSDKFQNDNWLCSFFATMYRRIVFFCPWKECNFSQGSRRTLHLEAIITFQSFQGLFKPHVLQHISPNSLVYGKLIFSLLPQKLLVIFFVYYFYYKPIFTRSQ